MFPEIQQPYNVLYNFNMYIAVTTNLPGLNDFSEWLWQIRIGDLVWRFSRTKKTQRGKMVILEEQLGIKLMRFWTSQNCN